MATYDLGKVVGDAGAKGDDGSTVWNTSTAPTYANSKYTFTISNLSGKTGLSIAVNDIIFYSTYYYIVSAVNSTTVDCSTRVSIKGSDASVTIVDNLTSDSSTSVLSAKQGKVLNTNKIETSAIATSFGSTTSDSKVPSEKLVKTELDKKIATSSTAGLVKNDGTVDINSYSTTSHTHGQVTSDGKVTSTAVTVASGDNILITDYSDSSKIKRVANILAGHVKDSTAHSNIGSSANDTQATINSDIDTALSGKQATLVSGTNIKTVNNESLLGSGNITIQGGSNVDVVTSWEATLSDTKVPSEKLTKNSLDAKADASSLATVATTGDYDDLTDKPTIPSASTTTPSADTSSGSYGSGTTYARSNHTHPKSSLYAEATHSHTKSQITDFPSIPSKTSDLTNDGADGTNVFVANNDSRLSDSRTPTSHTHGNLTNDGKVGSTANYFVYTTTSGAITSKQKIGNITTSGAIGTTSGLPIKTGTSGVLEAGSFGTTAGTFAEGNHTHSAYVNPTKVTSWSSTPSDDNVASEKLIKDSLDAKQATLVSGTSIKTINNETLLGSGNITIQGGGGSGGSYINDFYGDTSTNELVIDYDTGVSQADIVTSWSSTTLDTNVPSEKLTKNTLDSKVNTTDIADNLTTNDSTKVLSAKQGKALNDLIGAAITYINQ